MKNQAFVFIKPHAVGNNRVAALVKDVFGKNRIAVDFQRDLSGPQIAEANMVDAHYALNAAVGTCENPGELVVDRKAREKFAAEFGVSWDEALHSGRLVSGLKMCQRLGIDGETLNRLWAELPDTKLAGGLYVAFFPQQNCFVMNGFYPSLRKILTSPAATVTIMTVSFDPNQTSWKRFRREIVGTTNPAAAPSDSIRGWCYLHRNELGIAVGYRENVLHASASAFEALIEKVIWLGPQSLASDPLWSRLQPAGITLQRLIEWRNRNPVIDLDGHTGPLVDLLEERDTAETAEYLIEWQRVLATGRDASYLQKAQP